MVDASSDISRREKEVYNEGLNRDVYNWIFRYCDFHYDKKERKIIRDAISGKEEVLEVGSRAWWDWIENNDVNVDRVECINISEAELGKGRMLSKKSDMDVCFRVMDAHDMSFSDSEFDVVIGSGILHHLSFRNGVSEIMRVLRPGGVAIFSEPLGVNPVGKFVRWLTPFARTPDEEPLGREEIRFLEKSFECTLHFSQFLSVPFGVLSGLFGLSPNNFLNRLAYNIDESISDYFPFLEIYYREVLIVLEHKE